MFSEDFEMIYCPINAKKPLEYGPKPENWALDCLTHFNELTINPRMEMFQPLSREPFLEKFPTDLEKRTRYV